ncbi:bifunctional folylpolyglutamate synthase/dihydrofolate synthase [Caryophanon tenue]|uniref:tetrahydrofolate synthase n=1 Tax=Caryophanon tenue TaxID=33978 RepID=A0A1C0YMQ8_9BACL|nr:folylpolyglutamate synthase/dihydrofolate synthase family protein [Caryophanon tenue]OCS88438.1 hypothetical protein A6M13_00915 [Caryophanon tenue]
MEIQGLAHYKEMFGVASTAVITPGLSRVEAALRALGNPEKSLHIIHVAGTNGKGSTIGFLEQLCTTRQLQVGVFTSPAFIDVHDQLRLNGQHITPAQLEAAMETVAAANVRDLTDFELLTVVAYVAFSQANVDVAIIEAGMGGLLDATNVVKPVVSVITTVALEHTNFLGTTLKDIATHKAGIIKRGVPIIQGAVSQEAASVIAQTANKLHAPLFVYAQDFQVEDNVYRSEALTIHDLTPSLHGEHQLHNMALAIAAFEQFCIRMKLHIAPKRVQQAVSQVHVPYRFEQIRDHVYVDGAHNVAAAEALVATIREMFGEQRVHFVIGILADKDIQGILNVLAPVAASFTCVPFSHPRALSATQLASMIPGSKEVATLDEAIALANGEVVVVTGSLYLLATVVSA